MSCVWVLQRRNSVNEYDLAPTLCKYDLRKGDLFVLSWARVRQVRRGSISVNVWWRCAQYFLIVCCSDCCSDCVGVCGNVCCVAAVVKRVCLALEC